MANLEKSCAHPASTFNQLQEVCCRDLHAIFAIVIEEHLQAGISDYTPMKKKPK
jgi:hypothetical protein